MTVMPTLEAIRLLMKRAGIDEARIDYCLKHTDIERDVLNYLREYSGVFRGYTRVGGGGSPDKGRTYTS